MINICLLKSNEFMCLSLDRIIHFDFYCGDIYVTLLVQTLSINYFPPFEFAFIRIDER